MTKISLSQIEKIAKLSRISFAESELPEVANQLSQIISWVDSLNQVNTDNIVPMMAVEQDLNMRDDVVRQQNDTSEILQNACDKQYDFYAVPKVIE